MNESFRIDQSSRLWQYLSSQQRILAGDGAFLWEDSVRHTDEDPTDYSYIVFPFAKMYEGFLKQLLLDLRILSQSEYTSTHYRIGRSLSPNLVRRLGRHSAYGELARQFSQDLPEQLWHAWKEGRNLVFHYFPHNYRSLTREQAGGAISLILTAMKDAVELTNPPMQRKEILRYGQGEQTPH